MCMGKEETRYAPSKIVGNEVHVLALRADDDNDAFLVRVLGKGFG